MTDTETNKFVYLLNAVEDAASKKNPSKAGYAGKRRALLDYVATLERAALEGALAIANLNALERDAHHELRIIRHPDGVVTVDRWHRRYASFYRVQGATVSDAVTVLRLGGPSDAR